MSHTVLLTSYDRYVEVIEYHLPSGKFTVRERAADDVYTQGSFMREGVHVAGIFATPKGPVFFFDNQHVLLGFGSVTARVTKEPEKPVRHFALTARDASGAEHSFALRYEERIGIGANPYDNEIEDIDLLAMITRGLGNKAFFENYRKPWR